MKILRTHSLILALWFSFFQVSSITLDESFVRAVLFFSPGCGHCHYVINEVLPPLVEQYNDQLIIVGVDITTAGGNALFQETLEYFNLERGGVPFLVVGDQYLVGSYDIPEQFPGLVEEYLAQGGLDWPAIPGLAEALEVSQEAAEPTQVPTDEAVSATIAATPTLESLADTSTAGGLILPDPTYPGLRERLARDPAGNLLAIVVLVGMLLSVVGGVFVFSRRNNVSRPGSWSWSIPVLCLVGLFVAGYLAYVETTQVEAVCGPVGDCNTVQQSKYARLFGILPIGILGMVGYVLILLAWGLGRSANRRLAAYGSLAMLGLTAFGLLFSIYLTFLEPFVIGATCAWCLTSAVLMTILFCLSLVPGKRALVYLLTRDKKYSRRKAAHGTHT